MLSLAGGTPSRSGSGAGRRTRGRRDGRGPPGTCRSMGRRSVAGELAVGDAVRARGVGAQALHLVLLVGPEVTLEPVPLRGVLVVALVGQDVRGDAVQEPPVVGDDHGTAREVEQRVLEAAEGLDVQVVGGLVEEQQVAALLERERQVEAVALTAREDAGLLLLVRALEAEL